MISYLLIQMQKCINQFQTARSQSIIMVKMEKQKSCVDCQVYPIAVATSLAFGTDPTDVAFKQDVMKSHLIHSLR